MPLHLMTSYLHEEFQSSLAGDSHTATSALHFFDITYGAEPERCVDDTKIMPPEPTEETTEFRWYLWHGLTARDTVYTAIVLDQSPQSIVDHYQYLCVRLITIHHHAKHARNLKLRRHQLVRVISRTFMQKLFRFFGAIMVRRS
jgi:hypothetical protein